MNPKHLTLIIVIVLIAAMLGGAYLIVAKNATSLGAQETPSGFFH